MQVPIYGNMAQSWKHAVGLLFVASFLLRCFDASYFSYPRVLLSVVGRRPFLRSFVPSFFPSVVGRCSFPSAVFSVGGLAVDGRCFWSAIAGRSVGRTDGRSVVVLSVGGRWPWVVGRGSSCLHSFVPLFLHSFFLSFLSSSAVARRSPFFVHRRPSLVAVLLPLPLLLPFVVVLLSVVASTVAELLAKMCLVVLAVSFVVSCCESGSKCPPFLYPCLFYLIQYAARKVPDLKFRRCVFTVT